MSADRESPRDQDDLDRELSELISEIRVVLPAVTVLFAFLLTVPFSAGFDAASNVSRVAYFAAFLASAAAVVMLVGESAFHRLSGRPYDKAQLVRTASRQALAGIALLGVALAAVTFLVTDVLFQPLVAIAVTAALLLLEAVTWQGGRRHGCTEEVRRGAPRPAGEPAVEPAGSGPDLHLLVTAGRRLWLG